MVEMMMRMAMTMDRGDGDDGGSCLVFIDGSDGDNGDGGVWW